MSNLISRIFGKKQRKVRAVSENNSSSLNTERKYHDHFLDCTAMLCPKPIFETSSIIKNTVSEGDVLLVECKDPAFKADINAWTKRMSMSLELDEIGKLFRAYITKKNA